MKSKKGFFILLAVFLVLVVCYLALKVWTEKAQEEEQAKDRGGADLSDRYGCQRNYFLWLF